MKPFDQHPEWVQELMLTRQVEQGNPRRPEVFRNGIFTAKDNGGFNWGDTKEGYRAWDSTILNSKYSGLLKANPGIEQQWIYYTVSYDKNKRFILKKDKALNSKELSLITATLRAAGHKNIQIKQGVPPTPAITE